MVKVGLCDVTVGPHLFDAMLYTVKDPTAPQQIQYTPTQAQGPTRMVHYGPGNNFQQHQPYHSNQQRRPPYPPGPPGRPQNYQGNHSPAPRGPHTPGHPATPQSGQRPQPQPQPGQPAKPSPDPVIQMLATRAAADPDLKALMRVVASSQASQEQLRAFQAHIDELNAIIKAREQQEKRQQASTAAPAQPAATPTSTARPNPPSTPAQSTPGPSTQPSQDPASKQQPTPQPPSSTQTPQESQSQQTPATQGSVPPKPQSGNTPQSGSQPQTPGPSQKNQPPKASQKPDLAVKQDSVANGPTNTPQPLQPTPAPVAPAVSTPVHPTPPMSNTQQSTPRPGPPYPQYQQPAYGSQPPLQSRPPQYGSPMPYNRQPATPIPPPRPAFKSVVFEFTSPLTPYGSSTSGHAGSGDRYLFPEHSILEWLPNENTILASFLIIRKVDPNVPFPIEPAPDPTNSRGKGKGASKSKKGDKKGKGKEEPGTATPKLEQSDTSVQQAAPEASSEPVALKEYWQPVTFRIHAADTRILEPLTRVVKPADEVRKYMNEIMDRAERAPDGFLAQRLPKEDAVDLTEIDETPANAAPSGHRPSRSGAVKEESEAENNILDLMEEEEELLEFYGDPMALPPLRV